MQPYQTLWGKTDRNTGKTHLLLYHMIDVGEAANALWETSLADGIIKQISSCFELKSDETKRLFTFWASIHDLGKATPVFQMKYPPATQALIGSGLGLPALPASGNDFPHGLLSTYLIPEMLLKETSLPISLGRKIARALGGHHGSFPSLVKVNALYPGHAALGGRFVEAWNTARFTLTKDLIAVFQPPILNPFQIMQSTLNGVLVLLSGFTSVADWIGSSEDLFPYEDQPLNSVEYSTRSRIRAFAALQKLGWAKREPPNRPGSFKRIFGFSPYPIQKKVFSLTKEIKPPALIILEAPTGIGKTEMALMLADRWSSTDHQSGLYIAMPTMATSNQMYTRTADFLQKRYAGQELNVRLIHGQSLKKSDLEKIFDENDLIQNDEKPPDFSWFLPSKRSLLAPFGVGTIDQCLLSVLRSRHFFVRLFGLGRKTVIFDEVHAYDTYMTQLFQMVLQWLKQLGTSVVILSATLPENTRKELVSAYANIPPNQVSLPAADYPRLTWVSGDEVGSAALPKPKERRIAVEWVQKEPASLARRLGLELQHGGCAAVICNTVKRAQEVFKELTLSELANDTEIILFHARFPNEWRGRIEARVLEKFGKQGTRTKSIVVATQVIEQSLDLDFDLMISDLAPVDLILQRMGRLHRHKKTVRPDGLAYPRFLINRPDLNGGVPVFGSDRFVYSEYHLLRTYQVLKDLKEVCPISDTTTLIEMVYGETLPPGMISAEVEQAIRRAYQEFRKELMVEVREAKARLICKPDDEDFIFQHGFELEEDDPALHKSLQALTRLTEPTVSLVCLHQRNGLIYCEPEAGGEKVDLQNLSLDTVFEMLLHSVNVSNKNVVQFFLSSRSEDHFPANWQQNSKLKHCRLAVFTEELCEPENATFSLKLTHQYGLEVLLRR